MQAAQRSFTDTGSNVDFYSTGGDSKSSEASRSNTSPSGGSKPNRSGPLPWGTPRRPLPPARQVVKAPYHGVRSSLGCTAAMVWLVLEVKKFVVVVEAEETICQCPRSSSSSLPPALRPDTLRETPGGRKGQEESHKARRMG